MYGLPWREVCRHGGHYGKSRKTSQCQERRHHEDGVLPGTELLTCSVSPVRLPATGGCSRHLCSAAECSRARDPLSYWASPGVRELYGPHCHRVEWAVMCPSPSQGAAGEEGASSRFSASRGSAVTRARTSHSGPPRPSASWSARWAPGAGSYAASSASAAAASPLSSSGKWPRCQRWPCTDC